MKHLGIAFRSEIVKAGLGDVPMSWTESGEITFGDSVSEEDIAAVNVVYSAHDSSLYAAAKELSGLSMNYKAEISQLNQDWLSAIVSNGASEAEKKTTVSQRRAALSAKLAADMLAIKAKYA